MDVIRDWRRVPARLRGAVVALGNFDGVHRGHQGVIGITRSLACGLEAPAGVMSFHPHPRRFFSPDTPFFRLTPQPLKLRLLEALGVDVTFVVAFDSDLARTSAEAFISEVLADGLGVRHVVAGWNYRFGAKRAGDAALLERCAALHGMGVTILGPEQDASGAAFSSTRIRELLSVGDVRGAAGLLGYHWRFVGTVVGGDKRGRKLGFPTINLRLDEGVRLAQGIYAVNVHFDGRSHAGAAYHGTRPTFDAGEAFLETFILDFDGDLYGQEVEIEFVEFLRADLRFDTPAALAAQIEADCRAAREALDQARQRVGSGLTPLPLQRQRSTTAHSDA